MLQTHVEIKISPHSDLYDLLIPADHKLRRLKELVDFGFVMKELKDKYCHDNGRNAYSPVLMFKLLLLKCMFELSDRGVVERASTDLAFKYFLDINPEDNVPDSSSLCFFRRQRLKNENLLDLLIAKSVQIAKEHKLIKGTTMYVDATHTLARNVAKHPMEMINMLLDRALTLIRKQGSFVDDFLSTLPERPQDRKVPSLVAYGIKIAQSVFEHQILKEIDSVVEAARMLEEVCEDVVDHFRVSFDRDARVGHKTRNSSFFGYKTHLAMVSTRIITGATVTAGNADDGSQLPILMDKTQANLGQEYPITEVVGDGAYCCVDNLSNAKERNIEVYAKPTPALYKANDLKDDGFYFNKDAGMYVCPAGHQSISRCKRKRQKGKGNGKIRYLFSAEHCSVCKLKQTCCPKTKFKTYYVPDRTPEQELLMQKALTQEFREKMATRYMIEAKNAELKNVYGYRRANASGIRNMTLQSAMTIFVSNISRIIRLLQG